MSVPPDVLLNLLEVLAVTDLTNHPPDHVQYHVLRLDIAVWIINSDLSFGRDHRIYSRTVRSDCKSYKII